MKNWNLPVALLLYGVSVRMCVGGRVHRNYSLQSDFMQLKRLGSAVFNLGEDAIDFVLCSNEMMVLITADCGEQKDRYD